MNKPTFSGRRYAGILALLIGVILVILATWAVLMAPEGASIQMQNRTGRRQFELGLWALYIPPFLSFFMSWYGLRNIAEAGTRRPGLLVFLMTAVSAAWQWSMISEVMEQ